MSFILEALKKSEQQRQQKNTSRQKSHKRTLSTGSSRSNRRPYWIMAGFLPLILLSGWLFYNSTEVPLEQPPVANKVKSTPPPGQPMAAESTEAISSVASPPQNPVVVAAFAPVPRDFTLPPTRRRVATTVSVNKSIEKPPEPAVEPREIDKQPLEPISALPLYLNLSRELRDRMPRLTMSMHFYTTNPDRRLVRINNHLLHEDDWVNRDLQVIEITPTGATLDFMGKLFNMQNSSR